MDRPTLRTTSWLQEGYDAAEVDAFLDALFHAIATESPLPSILDQRFTSRRFGGATYDMTDVDVFLDEVQAQLGD